MSERSWLGGGWFITHSGIHIDPLDVQPTHISLEDVAHHLSLVNRYGGATPTPYSVASHSLMVCDMLEDRFGRDGAVEGLLHDAAEAYVGDMIKAIKVLVPQFSDVEKRFERAIRARFGLPAECPFPRAVKDADISALLCERRDVFGDEGRYADHDAVSFNLSRYRCHVGEDWRQTKAFFLARAKELGL